MAMKADHDYYHEEETGEDETPLLEENACRTIKQKVLFNSAKEIY